MIKKYTDAEYANAAIEANREGKFLYIYTHEEEKEIEVPEYDEEGNPIMIEYEDTEIVIDYDEEGNPIGQHEITVIKKKQKTHTETITEEVAELLIADENYYVCYKNNWTDKTVNENYEEEKAQKERQRLDMLSLTKREVFLALYKDKGITPDQLRAQIQDTEALIEFDYANDYFRGNPLINSIGAMLGYTPSELDYLFEYKNFPQPTAETEGEG